MAAKKAAWRVAKRAVRRGDCSVARWVVHSVHPTAGQTAATSAAHSAVKKVG